MSEGLPSQVFSSAPQLDGPKSEDKREFSIKPNAQDNEAAEEDEAPASMNDALSSYGNRPTKENEILRRPSLAVKYRSLGKMSVQFQSVREITTLQSEEDQTEKDLMQLHDFLEAMLTEQDTFLKVKKSVELNIQKALHTLMDATETSFNLMRIKLEPELHNLSEMILQEIQFYTTIKSNHVTTLSKLKAAINVIRSESAVRAKLGKKSSSIQQSVGLDVGNKLALQERVQKLELDMELLTALREKEYKEKSRLLTLNAQMSNEIDRLKTELKDEQEKNKFMQYEVDDLKNACKDLKKKMKTEMHMRLKEPNPNEESPETPSPHEMNGPKLPLVFSAPEVANRSISADKSWNVTKSKGKSTLAQIGESKTKGTGYQRPINQMEKQSPSRPLLRENESTRLTSSRFNITRLQSQFQTMDRKFEGNPSPSQSLASSTTKSLGFINPPPIWIENLYSYSRPQSYPITTNPTQWLYQISQGDQDMLAHAKELGPKISITTELFVQQKYLAWAHTIDSVFFTFMKAWSSAKREVEEIFSQIIWVLYDIGLFYFEAGNIESALSILKRMDGITSHFGGQRTKEIKYLISNMTAFGLFRQENFSKSYLQLQKSMRIMNENNPLMALETNLRIGFVLTHSRKFKDAIQSVKAAHKLFDSCRSLKESDITASQINSFRRTDQILTVQDMRLTIVFNSSIIYYHAGNASLLTKALDEISCISAATPQPNAYQQEIFKECETLKRGPVVVEPVSIASHVPIANDGDLEIWSHINDLSSSSSHILSPSQTVMAHDEA